jgi:hypothetical protein
VYFKQKYCTQSFADTFLVPQAHGLSRTPFEYKWCRRQSSFISSNFIPKWSKVLYRISRWLQVIWGLGRGKFALEQAKENKGRGWEQRCSSALDGSGQRHVSAALSTGKGTDSHCTGGYLIPWAGLDGCSKSRPTGLRSPDHLDRSLSITRLLWPAMLLAPMNIASSIS